MMQKWVRSDTRSWFSLFKGHYGWLAIGGAVAVLILTAISVWVYHKDATFVDQAVPVEADIIRQSGPRLGSQTDYMTTVRYTTPAGTFEGTIPVDLSYVLKPVGAKVTVYYMRDNPSEFALTMIADETRGGWIFQATAGLVGIATLIVGFYSISQATSAVHARRYGPSVKAKVLQTETIRRMKNDGHWFDMWEDTDMGRLVFVDDQGRQFKTMPHSLYSLRRWDAGEQINVYRGPKHSWWEGDVGSREMVPSQLPKVAEPPSTRWQDRKGRG